MQAYVGWGSLARSRVLVASSEGRMQEPINIATGER
jgi:hypothetical protein